jgi:hypothetical protein
MEWCEKNAVDFIFGLPGNAVLDRLVDETADEIRTRRALDQKPCLRGFAETSEMASRVRLAFAAACPDATLIRDIAAALMPTGP